MFIDANGNEIDGDMVEAACAIDLKNRGLLAGNTAVSTVMCNLGFVRAMEAHGIDVLQTAVGDRHVLQAMRDNGYVIGGEQSGHTILLRHNSTGDGLMTACQFISVCVRNGLSAAEAAGQMTRFPQELVNVRVADKAGLSGNEAIARAIAAAEEALGSDGRVLVRPSGTEPLIRVMVEAATNEVAAQHANAIAQVVEDELA